VIGLFLGEAAAHLKVVADGYIKLLQMTVLPYVTLSIVGGLGALDADSARVLGLRVSIVMALLWVLALCAVFLFPLMFPPNETASFFSTALLEEREPFNLVDLYIPANPFNSLANSVMPAIVLFSIVLGTAIIGVPDKSRLLSVLAVASKAVSRATVFVISLTPYGMCAIGAVVAGTTSVEQLQQLEVYLVSYAAVSLLVSLWVLPGLVAALTPIPYRAIMSRSRDALLMAFMTTSLFAVLPIITERAKGLVLDHGGSDATAGPVSEIIVPTSFNFPHTGKILTLSFVLFASWFMDAPLRWSDYPSLATTGLLAMFGSANAAIPFLLDLMKLPADTFHLFVASSVVNARVGSLVAAVHTLTLALLGASALGGVLTFNPRKVARFAVVTLVLAAATIGGTRVLLQALVARPYDKDMVLTSMQLRHGRPDTRVFRQGDVVPVHPGSDGSLPHQTRQRGILRIGYFDDSLPYAFFNRRGELVGFDIDMGNILSRDLMLQAEFVPVSREILERELDATTCDVVMSGVAVTVNRAAHVQFSSTYLDETVAFIVPDHRAAAFSEWSNVRAMGHLRIGVPRSPYYSQRIRDELTDADIVPIDKLDDIFKPHDPPIDAFVATAERGSAYTLLHPAYSIAIPKPRPFKVSLGYVIANRDEAMTSMVNTWIEQKRKDGTIDELFAYWILGQESAPHEPRWSVMRNVLHWTR
jgi:Na+/H+-dicarboxylate symporter/ABC-type amino acid transport substrate-binding protein